MPGASSGWQPELLPVPLVLAAVGAALAYLGVRRWWSGPHPATSSPRSVRLAFALGVVGLILAVLTTATAPTRATAWVWVVLPTAQPSDAPQRYADYLPATSGFSTIVDLLVGLIGASAAGTAVLGTLAGLREGRRSGRAGLALAVGAGIAALSAQLLLLGLAATTLLGEVLALLLGVAALVLTRRSVARAWFRRPT